MVPASAEDSEETAEKLKRTGDVGTEGVGSNGIVRHQSAVILSCELRTLIFELSLRQQQHECEQQNRD